jgi:hypothetical protein
VRRRQRVTFGEAFKAADRLWGGYETDATGCLGLVAVILHATWWRLVGVPVKDGPSPPSTDPDSN